MEIDWLRDYLGDLLSYLLFGLLHPFYALSDFFNTVITNVWTSLHGLYSALVGLFTTVIDLVSSMLSGSIPYIWLTIILIGFSVVFILRIYWFLKDVSILGNKV